MRRLLAAAVATCVAALSQAQPAPAAPDFSEGSARPSAAQLSQRLAGNVFVATLANGVTWRMDYASSAGYVFFDISNGARDTAKWRAEEGRVCYEFQRAFPSGCSEYRIVEDKLFLRRGTGEVLALEKK
jgi:hypothetical protein